MQTSCDCAILNPALIQLMSAALSGFNLGTVLLASIVLFPLACLFFGTQGGYYNTDKYDGNGTAH
ncbi:MAG: hypothetical protein VKI93_05370 [Synechococcus sp.]|nr:hypothetical protein [Synechococcus sp.]